MQLNLTDPAALKLVTRLGKELGELMVSNAFMDEIGNDLITENTQMRNEILVLRDKIVALQGDNDKLKNQIDETRNGRFDSIATKQNRRKKEQDNQIEYTDIS